MQMPTPDDVRDVAQCISGRSSLYKQAVVLRDQAFMDHFRTLPDNLARDFTILRKEYVKIEDAETDTDPNLRVYWNMAAKRFHPDIVGNDSKVPFFEEATEAYRKHDLRTLQILLLQDMAGNFDSLSPEDKEFLLAEYPVMETVAESILEEGMKIVLAAVELEQMSDQWFLTEIEEACQLMAREIKQKTGKEDLGPSLLEG